MTAINFSISYNGEMYLFKAEALYEDCRIRMISTFRELYECTKVYTFMSFSKLLFTYPKKKIGLGGILCPSPLWDSSKINQTGY